MERHFTKVHDQTIEIMAGYVAEGRRAGVDVATLDGLPAAVVPGRAPPAAATP